MTKFEEYLLEIGYKRYVKKKDGSLIHSEYHNISTMGDITYFYSRDEFKSDRTKDFIFGLQEYGKPSTLLSPKPIHGVKRGKSFVTGADAMEAILFKYDPSYVYNCIQNGIPIKVILK